MFEYLLVVGRFVFTLIGQLNEMVELVEQFLARRMNLNSKKQQLKLVPIKKKLQKKKH